MDHFLDIVKKPIVFMLASGFGCFVAAILAEPLFIPPPLRYVPPPAPAPMFCLTFDDSGSMRGFKREAVKQAARDFVNKRNLEAEKVGIVVFSSSSRICLPLSNDKRQVLATIDSYYQGGGTYFAEALGQSLQVFQNDRDLMAEEARVKEVNEKIKEQNERDKEKKRRKEPIFPQSIPKIVLFFTDGQNADQVKSLQKATQLREEGVMLYAIATRDGNKQYLTQMTGDPAKVFMTDDRDIADAFKQVEQEIEKIAPARGGLLESRQKDAADREEISGTWMVIQAVVWSILLCMGMSVCIVMVQNRIMRKPVLSREQTVVLAICAFLGGVVAGYLGNAVFQIVGIELIGRIVGWGLLGAVLALGMSFFIANLDRQWALLGGVLGGIGGAVGFLIFAIVGDTSGRLIGAFILGACIGLMIGLVEQVYRNVWLMVLYDPRDFTQVNLGNQTVTVGSGKNDTVFIADAGPGAAKFRQEGDNIRFTDGFGTKILSPGSHVKVGNVELVICSKDVPFSPSGFYPMKMSRALELQGKKPS